MRLATLRSGGRDGTLVAVDSTLSRCARVPHGPATLQQAFDDGWGRWEKELEEACERLDAGELEGAAVLDHSSLASPLPRAHHWAEGSTYLSHMRRCREARGAAIPTRAADVPVIYQSGADSFLPPVGSIELDDRELGLDLEATVAVVVDDVPQGTTEDRALEHVKLVVLANDLTHRNLLDEEMATGVGLYRSKPARPLSAVALSPSALGEAWREGRLHARIRCTVRGEVIGEPDAGSDCAFGFDRLIARMTQTRGLAAGSLVGSGTVSNEEASRGVACLAELRALDALAGRELTPYLGDGDVVRIEALDDGERSLFGPLEHEIVQRGAAR